MQKINKNNQMPTNSAKWISKNKKADWKDLPNEYRQEINQQLNEEQHGLCCYCCQSLENKSTSIEHLYCRDRYPKKCFNYDNLLLSCQTSKQCNHAKANKELSLHPLMKECDIEIKINLAGELIAYSTRAEEAIQLLNLNNKKLCYFRKSLLDMISFTFDPSQTHSPPISILDKNTLQLILNGLGNTSQYHELKYIINKLT